MGGGGFRPPSDPRGPPPLEARGTKVQNSQKMKNEVTGVHNDTVKNDKTKQLKK